VVSPTIDVRINAPFPALRTFRPTYCRAAAARRSPARSRPEAARASTLLVWMPMSVAPSLRQRRNPSAMSSSAEGPERSAPVELTSAMLAAIWVSSLHSPGE
jgi:hypothetical protein